MCAKIISVLLFCFCICEPTTGQQTNPAAKQDSSKVYRKIEAFSKRGGFTKFIYGLFFRPVATSPANLPKAKKRKIQRPLKDFEGKIIRSIDIITLDPFGYSVNDTGIQVQNNLYKAGNRLHLKTQIITIRNLLLIHRYDVFDSLLVKESERLIRTQKFVKEVAFFSVLTKEHSDSVDILIRVLDLWSIIPGGAISPTRAKFELNDKNFLGLGHGFENAFTWNHSNGNNAFNSNYYIPNIRNTYINSTLHYGIDENKNYIKSLNVERPFFSSFAKWAAGMYIEQNYRSDTILQNDSLNHFHEYKFNKQDYWGGVSHQIFKGNTEDERTTNLIFGLRYIRIRYLKRPDSNTDSLHVYSNSDFYLASIGISNRKYIQDKYIFNYGIVEDVPVGKVYGLTSGYQIYNNSGRMYFGLRFSYGNYNEWGYMSTNFEYGTFLHISRFEQSVFNAGLNYFTNLFEIGKWKFRQFVKPGLTLGFKRTASENILINNEKGIPGFNSTTLYGTKKIILTLQTQSYAPWNLIGFRFGPYLIYSLGMLGDDVSGFRRSKIYSQLGFGLLIKNEYLVFNFIQVSIAFYPSIPGIGDNIFKINPDKTSDFGFQNFEFGRPSPVIYQ